MKLWDDPRIQRVRSNLESGHCGGYGPGRRRVGSGPPSPGRSGYQVFRFGPLGRLRLLLQLWL